MPCEASSPSIQHNLPAAGAHVSYVGYSCQTHLLLALRHHFSGSDWYMWFSRELCPPVHTTSRPTDIFDELLGAVREGMKDIPKIQSLVRGYLTAVEVRVSAEDEKARLVDIVSNADLSWFRPVLLKVSLDGLPMSDMRSEAQEKGGHARPDADEYLCVDLPVDRVSIIAE